MHNHMHVIDHNVRIMFAHHQLQLLTIHPSKVTINNDGLSGNMCTAIAHVGYHTQHLSVVNNDRVSILLLWFQFQVLLVPIVNFTRQAIHDSIFRYVEFHVNSP